MSRNKDVTKIPGMPYIEANERVLLCLGDGREIGGIVIDSTNGYVQVVLDSDGTTLKHSGKLPERREAWARKAIYASFRAGMKRHHDKAIEGESKDLRAYRLGGATIIVRKN